MTAMWTVFAFVLAYSFGATFLRAGIRAIAAGRSGSWTATGAATGVALIAYAVCLAVTA